jgi:hypothetical protein
LLLWRKENRRWYENLEFLSKFVWPEFFLKVPPPRKFHRPVGGSGSVALHVEPAAHKGSRRAATASPEPNIPRPRPRQQQRRRGKTSQKSIFGEGVEEECRSSTPQSSNIYPQSILRGFSTTKAAQLVRLIYRPFAQHVTFIWF